jgi:hypothetical protein
MKLHFENTADFEGLFKRKDLEVTRQIVKGVQTAITDRTKSAKLFEISFSNVEEMYEITLPTSQWELALSSCLDHLHKEGLADEQIDCWKLLEIVKTEK